MTKHSLSLLLLSKQVKALPRNGILIAQQIRLKLISLTPSVPLNIDQNEENHVDLIWTNEFNIHNVQMIEKGISDPPY